MSSAVIIIEMLSGILRFFPNMMVTTLFVGGILLGKLPWVMASIGGGLVTLATLTLQYLLTKTIAGLDMPGEDVIKSCSLVPDIQGGAYMPIPSLWVALSSFYATYIFRNAANIYTQTPKRTTKAGASVMQRKGVGLLSMFAVLIFFMFLLIPRYWTNCETIGGIIFGLVVGIFGGYTWWSLMDACGPNVYPDIHGVMIGINPGAIKTNPVICAPRQIEVIAPLSRQTTPSGD